MVLHQEVLVLINFNYFFFIKTILNLGNIGPAMILPAIVFFINNSKFIFAFKNLGISM